MSVATLWAQSPIDRQRAAIARQRESVRRQAATLGVRAAQESTATPPDADCERIEDSIIASIIDSAAKTHDVQAKLLRAVIERESGFHPCAVSSKGAQGLMQLMPATAAQLNVKDPFDPLENVDAGTRYLKGLLDKYKGDLEQALGAYNAGPSAVDQAGAVPDFPETRGYVDWIMGKIGITRTDPLKIQMPTPTEN